MKPDIQNSSYNSSQTTTNTVALLYTDETGSEKRIDFNENTPVITIGSRPNCDIIVKSAVSVQSVVIFKKGRLFIQDTSRKNPDICSIIDGWVLPPGLEMEIKQSFVSCGITFTVQKFKSEPENILNHSVINAEIPRIEQNTTNIKEQLSGSDNTNNQSSIEIDDNSKSIQKNQETTVNNSSEDNNIFLPYKEEIENEDFVNAFPNSMEREFKFYYHDSQNILQCQILNSKNPSITIGRSADNQLQTMNASVSRHHALLVWRNSHAYIMDPPQGQASNGIQINDKLLQAGEIAEILSGNKISCGRFEIEVDKFQYSTDDYNISSSPNSSSFTKQSASNSHQLESESDINDEFTLYYKDIQGVEQTIILNENNPCVQIGRNPDCQIHTTDGTVSRRHAVVEWKTGKAFIMNPPTGKATNGIKVDGLRLKDNEVLEIFDGSQIFCGNFEIKVKSPVSANKKTIQLSNLSSNDTILANNNPPISTPVQHINQPMPAPFNSDFNHSMGAPVYGPPVRWMPPVNPSAGSLKQGEVRNTPASLSSFPSNQSFARKSAQCADVQSSTGNSPIPPSFSPQANPSPIHKDIMQLSSSSNHDNCALVYGPPSEANRGFPEWNNSSKKRHFDWDDD